MLAKNRRSVDLSSGLFNIATASSLNGEAKLRTSQPDPLATIASANVVLPAPIAPNIAILLMDSTSLCLFFLPIRLLCDVALPAPLSLPQRAELDMEQ